MWDQLGRAVQARLNVNSTRADLRRFHTIDVMSQWNDYEVHYEQCKLIKSSLGLKSYCRNTPLLHALCTCVVSSNGIQELKLLRNMYLSKSCTSRFYTYLFSQYLQGTTISPYSLFCESFGISVITYICDKKYAASQNHKIVTFQQLMVL